MQLVQQGQMPPVQFCAAREMNTIDTAILKKNLSSGRAAFLDIDTQVDFMLKPEVGKERSALYLSGAEGILGNLGRLTQAIANFKLPALFTMDTHTPDDPEFQNYKDFSDTHCVEGTEGWNKVPESVIPNEKPALVPINANQIPKASELLALFRKGTRLDIRKNQNSVFNGNPQADALFNNLKQAGIKTIVIYGVATDICVQQAVEGLKERDFEVVVVKDAVHELAENGVNTYDHPVYDGSVQKISTNELLALMPVKPQDRLKKSALTLLRNAKVLLLEQR